MENLKANLPIIKVEQHKKLSKLQSEFNNKIKRISELKENIEQIKVQVVELNQRIEKDVVPIEKELVAERVELVKAMEYAYYKIKLSKQERNTLKEMLINETWDLIDNHRQTELIVLYDQFNEIPFEEEQKQVKEESEKYAFEMFKNMTGVNLNDLDLGENSEGMDEFERMHRMKIAYEEKIRQDQWEKDQKNAKRKKSPKQEAKERKMREEAEMLTKSSRTIYMELAKELHPDREPDEEKRTVKTKLMQRITVAYDDNDLYELLRLRLEYKQSLMDADSVPEKQLELYIKVLKEQISALQEDYSSFFHSFNPQTKHLQDFGLGKNKSMVTRSINKEKRRMQEEIKSVRHTRTFVFNDLKALKQYIKQFRKQMQFDDDLGSLIDLLGFRDL